MFKLVQIMLICLPFSVGGWSVEFAGVTFHLYTLLVVLILPAALLAVATGLSKYAFNRLDLAIVLLAFTFFASTLLADVETSGWRITFHALFIPIASYFICKVFVSNQERLGSAINALFFGVVILSIATIFEFAETRSRPFVFEMPPIGVATLLIFGVIISAFVSFEKSKVALFIKLGVVGAAFILTFSRVYSLLLLMAPIMYQILKKRAMTIWTAFFVASFVFTMIFTYGLEFDNVKLHGPANQDTADRLLSVEGITRAAAGRAFVYRDSLSRLDSNILLGEGISRGDYQITPHNFNVEWLQYGGVMGYLAYLAVFLLHINNIRAPMRQDKRLAALNLALLIIVINSLSNGFMHGIMPYLAFIIIALSEVSARLSTVDMTTSAELSESDSGRQYSMGQVGKDAK